MACLATLADLQSFDRTKLSFGEMKKPETCSSAALAASSLVRLPPHSPPLLDLPEEA